MTASAIISEPTSPAESSTSGTAGDKKTGGTLQFSTTNVMSGLDPRLQRACAQRHSGRRRFASASTSSDELAVIAKVSDYAAWEALSEVRTGSTLGNADQAGVLVVTARIPVSRVEYVRSQPFVVSLKAAQRLKSQLVKTTSETQASPTLLPTGNKSKGGQGVVVGIVDFGCDFAHKNFLNAPNKPRVEAIWDQNGIPSGASPVSYGRLHTATEIAKAVKKTDPYSELGYGPEPDTPTDRGSHGTHVMDIAAGNGRGSGVAGVAPKSALIFVEVASSDIPWSGAAAVGKSFGDSVQLLEAVQFIFERAGTRPCVVNLSLGTNGGPHDGSTLVEQGLDRLIQQAPNRAVVIAASNSFADGIHATGTVTQGGFTDLKWVIADDDATQNELELWYSGADRITLELLTPDGASLGKVAPGQNRVAKQGSEVILFAANRLNDPNNHDNMIGVFVEAGLPTGTWTVRLHGNTISNGRFQAWIERDDAGQSSFAPPHDNSQTIGSISCGRETIVVGSYDAHKTSVPLSYFSSAGPTRDGREKPEVSAPGHAVMAAHSRTKTGVIQMSGTSMASPAVTGIVALLLAEAKARGKKLTSTQIRDLVTKSARRSPPPGTAWDPRYGAGRISAASCLKQLIPAGSPTAAAKSKSKSKPKTTSSAKVKAKKTPPKK